jgi:hypothetical protein
MSFADLIEPRPVERGQGDDPRPRGERARGEGSPQLDVECRLPLGESAKRGLAVALPLFLEQRELGPVADGQIARAWVSEGAAYSSFFFG